MSASHRSGEGDLVFTPTRQRIGAARLTSYLGWLASHRDLDFRSYEDLWSWSVSDLEGFWSSIWSFSGFSAFRQPDSMVGEGDGAEGGRFFVGGELNYVSQVLRHPERDVAVVTRDESGLTREVTYGELAGLSGALAEALRARGVSAGDRVAAVLPNGLEAVVGFLATASLGAIWSCCAPEFGLASLVDRLGQIRPKVLFVADRYRYGGKTFEMGTKSLALSQALARTAIVTVPTPGQSAGELTQRGYTAVGSDERWAALVAEPAPLEPVALPASHPLWALYSSGTTGLPKVIVHSHGGIVLEHGKTLALHQDLRPGDRLLWYTTTGWMMWNYLVGGLLVGATIVCYDGSPTFPGPYGLFEAAAELGVTCLGLGAPFIESCRRSGLSPRDSLDLSRVHTVGSTGAPLSPEGALWASEAIGDDVLVASISGGTDVCTAFLTACPLLEARAGELQCRALGAAVAAFDSNAREVVGEVGELVITRPMPSMPISLWGDDDGVRLHETYFATYPGIWRHGDWVKITSRGSAVVYGRSDATLNRGGVRMGTAELYRVVDSIPGVTDSLAVDTSELGRDGELILLISTDGAHPEIALEIAARIRSDVSPRHVPDRIVEVPVLPHTLNGKRIEIPIKRILLGEDPTEVVARDSLDRPELLDDLLVALAGLMLK